IPAETRLPSIRQLCDYLKVSKTTVETTYQQLLAEGYIVSRERSGFYVVELERDLFSSLLGESSALMESDGRADQDR
ncbi:GntR family transcriptional regulator, partial [Microbacteriaceae bacterium K1510]|nr:GntR family transcriptional regulator [Microbacteriaceae bacterium K1510]